MAAIVRRALALTGLALLATSALAADDDGPHCNRDGNQMELNACAAQDFRASDARLNARYRKLMASLAPAAQVALRTEQRAWLERRDPSCRARIKGLGSIAPLEYSACQKELTERRVQQLEAKAPLAR